VRLLDEQYLAPKDDPRLFELQVGLGIVQALESLGLRQEQPSSLLPPGGAPFAVMTDPSGRDWHVWWQRPLWNVTTATARSYWKDLLVARDGLRDMLAYLSDASELLQGMADPHGLVVAWNSQAAPTHSAEVTIANQHNFQSTIQYLVFGIERGPGVPVVPLNRRGEQDLGIGNTRSLGSRGRGGRPSP
jgi:hypothetical protein